MLKKASFILITIAAVFVLSTSALSAGPVFFHTGYEVENFISDRETVATEQTVVYSDWVEITVSALSDIPTN